MWSYYSLSWRYLGEIGKLVGRDSPDFHFVKAYDLSQKALDRKKTACAKRIAVKELKPAL